MRCCLLAFAATVLLAVTGPAMAQQGQVSPPPRPLELIAPGNDEPQPSAVFKEPTSSELVPSQPQPPATLDETSPPVLIPPDFVPPAAMSTAGMPPPSFSSPYVPYEAGPEIPPYGERWRYMARNGVYWYYTPQRKWMYWSQGRWVQFESPAYSNTPVGLQPPVVSRRFRRAAGRVGVGGGAPNYLYPYPSPGNYGGAGVGVY
jgi:hypothetical protein